MRRLFALTAVAVALGLPLPVHAEPPALRLEGRAAAPGVPDVAASSVLPVAPARAAAVANGEPSPAAALTAAIAPVVVEKPQPVPPTIVARINLATQRMEVSVNGISTHSWAVSSGRSGFESPRGTWRVQWTVKMHYSRKYDNAPMPHSVFFTGGVAVHATSAVGMLGRPASHGCIRLAPANAAQFYALVNKHGAKQTEIQVFGNPPIGAVAARSNRDNEASRAARNDGRAKANRNQGQQNRRVAALDVGGPTDGRQSFVQNGVRYVRVR